MKTRSASSESRTSLTWFDNPDKLERMGKVAEMKTAIVTGPTGVLGTALVRHLAHEGVRTVALVRPGSSRMGNVPKSDDVEIVDCGLDQLNRASTLLSARNIVNCDAWFHLGWMSTFGADARNDMVAQIANIQYSLDAVAAADELGCRVFVGVGSQAEFGRHNGPMGPETPAFPENGYGIAKLASGAMTRIECAKRGIRHEWMRVFSVYGPNDNPNTLISSTIRTLLANEAPSVTAGEQLWDYLYADDAARALFLAAEAGLDGATYCVGSGEAKPLRDYLEIIRNSIDGSPAIGYGAVPYSPNQVMFLQADITSLREDTGFEPAVTFEEGVRRTIAWMKEA